MRTLFLWMMRAMNNNNYVDYQRELNFLETDPLKRLLNRWRNLAYYSNNIEKLRKVAKQVRNTVKVRNLDANKFLTLNEFYKRKGYKIKDYNINRFDLYVSYIYDRLEELDKPDFSQKIKELGFK